MTERIFPQTVPGQFWSVIEEAQQDPLRLKEMLKQMTREDIINFYWTYEELANWLRTEPYWRHASPDISEDGMYELANWIVAQGKKYYREIFNNPEQIPLKKNDPGLLSEVVIYFENHHEGDLPVNNNEWDDEWNTHGKNSPWGELDVTLMDKFASSNKGY